MDYYDNSYSNTDNYGGNSDTTSNGGDAYSDFYHSNYGYSSGSNYESNYGYSDRLDNPAYDDN